MKKVAILCASVPLLVFVLGTGVAVVIWLALILEIKPGVFTSYLVSMTMVVRPVKNLSKINEVIQTGWPEPSPCFEPWICLQRETKAPTSWAMSPEMFRSKRFHSIIRMPATRF